MMAKFSWKSPRYLRMMLQTLMMFQMQEMMKELEEVQHLQKEQVQKNQLQHHHQQSQSQNNRNKQLTKCKFFNVLFGRKYNRLTSPNTYHYYKQSNIGVGNR